MSFINSISFKCLLGQQSKNIQSLNDIYSWTVGKKTVKQHFTTDKNLSTNDLSHLQSISPSNFHYLSEENLQFLKQHFKVKKTKNTSIIIDIADLSFRGNQFKGIRYCLNKCRNLFSVEPNFRSFNDVSKLIEEWSNNYTKKYFRDFSGKNAYFYKHNFHQNCISAFIYHQNELVAFGTLTPPQNGLSSYVIGKALYKRHYGLSQFADVELYKLGQVAGISKVNMGQASKGLLHYKTQFMHTKEPHYDGNIQALDI